MRFQGEFWFHVIPRILVLKQTPATWGNDQVMCLTVSFGISDKEFLFLKRTSDRCFLSDCATLLLKWQKAKYVACVQGSASSTFFSSTCHFNVLVDNLSHLAPLRFFFFKHVFCHQQTFPTRPVVQPWKFLPRMPRFQGPWYIAYQEHPRSLDIHSFQKFKTGNRSSDQHGVFRLCIYRGLYYPVA